MTVKGVKLKSESFFSISYGILELRRKTLRGADYPPPGMDRVKNVACQDGWQFRKGRGLREFFVLREFIVNAFDRYQELSK